MGKGSRTRAQRRESGELWDLLYQQFQFLRSSALALDAGDMSEAVRLAVTVRVLVHDTDTSVSLLKQLEVKDRVAWRSNVLLPGTVERSVVAHCNLVVLGGPRYVPAFTMRRTRDAPVVPFARWWGEPIATDPGVFDRFTRRDLVLNLANKQGGTHVDPKGPSEAYRSLDGSNFMGFEVVEGVHPSDPAFRTAPGTPVAGSVAAVAMRQVADEVGISIEPLVLRRLGGEGGT